MLVEFNAFANCFALEEVKLSENMALLDESLFEGCRSLKVVDLPAKLVAIGRRAFKDCTSLDQIILPIGLKSVGFDAFAGCTALRRIAIPRDIRELEDEEVFGGCDSLTEISFGGSQESWEMLCHGKALTVERTDATVHTPKIIFLNILH